MASSLFIVSFLLAVDPRPMSHHSGWPGKRVGKSEKELFKKEDFVEKNIMRIH
jgi:hypothetical protein